MGVGTMVLIVIGSLLVAGLMTMLLDAIASYCFRPLQAIEVPSAPDEASSY